MSISKIKKIRISTYDRKWSKLAREKTPYCWYCGTPDGLNAHHFIRRAIKGLRLDLANAVILCTSHHVFNHEFSAHKTPEKFERWYKKKFPGHYKYLKKESQRHCTEREAIEIFKRVLKEIE